MAEEIGNKDKGSHFGRLSRLIFKMHFSPGEGLPPDAEPEALYQDQKRYWEGIWSEDGFDPIWKPSEIPEELSNTVQEGWFVPGGTMVDIGCGGGEISRWLAEQGFETLGIDYSNSAVRRARSVHGDSSLKLSFETADATQLPEPHHLFDNMFDRGCFHVIPPAFAEKYKESVCSWSKPGSRMLLSCLTEIGPAEKEPTVEARRQWWHDYIQRTFEDSFDIERFEPCTYLFNTKVKKNIPVPGIAVWMIRK